MNALRNRQSGATATIVGCGPSILRLTAADFVPGPVIALNHAILIVRGLGLPNPLYSMQKDGCQLHNESAVIPLACVCPSEEMVTPLEPEELLLSVAESSGCFPDYPRRHVVDVEALGLQWCMSSAPTAVKLAEFMGCTSIRMLGHDAYATGDTGRIPGGIEPPERARFGYRVSGLEAQRLADEARIAIDWV